MILILALITVNSQIYLWGDFKRDKDFIFSKPQIVLQILPYKFLLNTFYTPSKQFYR